MGAKWQRFKIAIPKGLRPSEREVLADEIIDFMVERTKNGKSWKNRTLPGYSKEYIDSLEFKIAGKSAGDVNLTLSGDMLGSLELLAHKNGEVTIGFEKGSEENAKADGNIRGTYGKSKPVGPKRDFLGITKKDLKRVLDNFGPLDREVARRTGESDE